MNGSDAPQASLLADFYRKEAQHLLRLRSVDDIERFLSTTQGLDFSLLLKALREVRDGAERAGKIASAKLASFVLDAVEAYVRERNFTPEAPSVIDTPESLLQAAASARSALSAARLLKKHRHLLSQELINNHLVPVLDKLHNSQGNRSPTPVRLLLCFVIVAKILGDRECLGKFTMMWASHSRDEGRLYTALRRFAQAEKLADSPFLRSGVLVGSASVYDQLGDTKRAADAYAAALEIDWVAVGNDGRSALPIAP
jgi:hypothetical protein